MAKKAKHPRHSLAEEEIEPLNGEQQRIVQWLTRVRFRRKLLGGVNERDVWKKIDELNRLYHLALVAERARYDALLQAQREAAAGAEDNKREGEGK